MIYGKTFLEYFEGNKLGKWNFNSKSGERIYEFSFEEYKRILELDIVHDGLKGGFVGFPIIRSNQN
jgi:hypothetical protein